jgi:undecaprenyl-diphosphatase
MFLFPRAMSCYSVNSARIARSRCSRCAVVGSHTDYITDRMDYLTILLLAVIQGAAELLPVSSSAHVILTAKLLGLRTSSPEFVFLLVMLHTGTMFAVLYYFWPRWRWLVLPSPESGRDSGAKRHFWLMLILATACTGVLGLALKMLIERVILEKLLGRDKAQVEDLFESLPLIAACLFAVGIVIIAAGSRKITKETLAISTRSALWIGLVQGLCLPLRGFSRSGATISTALWRGIERSLAEEFSFALAVILTPPVIVRGLYRLLSREWPADTHLVDLLLPGLVGMVFSFAAGLVALRFLSAVLEKGRWKYFGYYCVAAAAVMTAAALAGY